jgi:rod shape-determining protein MreD
MIMPRGQQLLLPANPLFVLLTLLAALFANMVVNISLVGNAAWMPDFLALVLVFWCVHQPRLVGIGVAFFFGVATDVHQASLMGQHAMSYTALGFMAIMVHRRLLWFTVPSQAMQVLPMFVVAHALELTVRMMSGALFPGWMILLSPLFEAVLWPLVSVLLLAPQRRAPSPDLNRPL